MSSVSFDNAGAWGLPRVLDFFAERRTTGEHVYPSEWFFLKERLGEGISVLDVGCAQGGFATIIGEHVSSFRYTGLDVNPEMISRARARHPDHIFHHVAEGTFGLNPTERFDLVLVLGILHLHEIWRETLSQSWAHCGGTLIFDLRESAEPTIEDKARSYFRMDFNGGDDAHHTTNLPYVIVNSGDALALIEERCGDAKRLENYRYRHPVSAAAVTPIAEVMASVYCAER